MFNNLKSGSGTIDTIEVNLNPKRKFLYVDNDNFITPSTTAGISQIGYDDDIEIKNEATNPSIALYSSTGLNPKIDFIRFGRTFGTDSTNDWRIQNNDNLSISSGKNLTTTEKIKITDNNLELSSVDLLIPTTKKAQSEKYTGLSTSTNFDLGLTGDTGIINSFRDITINTGKKAQSEKYTGLSTSTNFDLGILNDTGVINSYRDITVNTGKKITTPDAIVSSLTASKMVLTDNTTNGKKLISSLYTDTDFARLTANNIMSGANSFTGNNTFSGRNIFTGGLTTETSNQVFNLNDSNSLRNIFRFYLPVYDTVVNNGATNPQTFTTTSANGITYSNGFWSLNAYTPTNDGIVIPNGQPFYFRNQATLTTTFNTDRTNLTSAVQMITGKIIMFIFNINTNLYEFIGIVNESSVPTSNQFNSKTNSFTLPTTRGLNNNILISNGSGGTSWATSISTGNINSSGDITLLSTGTLNTNKIRGLATTSPTGNITIGDNQTTANITIGNSNILFDDGLLTVNKETLFNNILKTDANSAIYSNSFQALTSAADLSFGLIGDTGKFIINRIIEAKDDVLLNWIFPPTPIGSIDMCEGGTHTQRVNINGDLYFDPLGLGKEFYTDTITGKSTLNNNINIGKTSDTSSKITLNRETHIGTIGHNRYLKTDLFNALTSSTNMFIGDIGDTGDVDFSRNIEVIDNTKGIFTPLLAPRSATFPNSENLNIGFSNTTNYTGNINLNQNVVMPTGRKLKTERITGIGISNALILGEAGDTGDVDSNRDIEVIGTGKGVFTERIGAKKMTLPNTNILNVGFNDVVNYTGVISLNQNTEVPIGRTIKTENIQSNTATTLMKIASTTTTANVNICEAMTTGNLNIGNASQTGRINMNGLIKQERTLGVAQNNFFSIGYGNNTAPKLFSTTALTNKFFTTTMFATAPTEKWSIWESNAGLNEETSAICMNQETTMIINSGDENSLWWLDEDTIQGSSGAVNYNWSGWRIAINGAFFVVSDRRYKKDIKPILKENLLEILDKIDIVTYKLKAPTEDRLYKNGKIRKKYTDDRIGVIAQDVIKAGLKEVVVRENDESYWTVNYTDLNMYFNLGVKELIKENIKKDDRIKILEDKVLELENKTNISTVDKVLELETKNHELETKYNNLSTELQKMKELLIFKFGDVL